jgi:hypothetical protein
LTRLKPDRDAGKRAIVIAVHHPPLSVDAVHGGSTGVQADLDSCCSAANLWPDLVLSGHAHLYQRFTHRTAAGKEIPYIVAGNGGYAVTPPMTKSPPAGTTVGSDTLAVAPILEFGYLTITANATELSVVFKVSAGGAPVVRDSVVVDLQKNRISSPGVQASKTAPGKTKPKRSNQRIRPAAKKKKKPRR